MPKVFQIFRSKSATPVAKKQLRTRSTQGGIFRKKRKSAAGDDRKSSLQQTEIQRSSVASSIEQNITWTLSADSQHDQFAANKDITEDYYFRDLRDQTFVFTEADLIQNELNHIQALSKLEYDVNALREITDKLVAEHASEIAKKDDEYVELLIKLGEKDEELANIRAELKETKENLSIVSSQLIQTQHLIFEDSAKGFLRTF